MDDDDERRGTAEATAHDAERVTPDVWVIGEAASDCVHPPDRPDRLGGDGLNGYYQCEGCKAVLVIADEVEYLSKNATDDSDETG